MQATAQIIYAQVVQALSPAEQLQLATLLHRYRVPATAQEIYKIPTQPTAYPISGVSITAQAIYTQVFQALSPIERLQLATLILNGLNPHDLSFVYASDTWSEQDQIDVTTFSLQYAAALFPENEEMV
jgi:hypothetical protein